MSGRWKIDPIFTKMDRIGLSLSFDDVRLKSGHSKILPADVILATYFSRHVHLNSAFASAAMDTVTEHKMAIADAKDGGIGIIHRGNEPKEQAAEVGKVKFHWNGLIQRPITVKQSQTMQDVLDLIKEKDFSFRSFLVVDEEMRLVGLISGNDFEFCTNTSLKIKKVMTTNLITAAKSTSIRQAYQIMLKHKKKILPLVNRDNTIAGMYVYSDVKRIMTEGSSSYNLDHNGNLRVGAAIGVDDAFIRTEMLVAKGVDVVVMDTAHADTQSVIRTLRALKKRFTGLDVVVGNISEPDSAKRLVRAGADGIKVGQGPGSICTTRIIAGIGCPQVTAIYNCAKAIRGSGVPICADGGIEYSGDITIALAAGAHSVMLGKVLAGTKEAPGKIIIRENGTFKEYRGMGSLGAMEAMQSSRERYGQAKSDKDKLVPEGVETEIPYKGEVAPIIFQYLGGLRSGMGYAGARTIPELHKKADFRRISAAGRAESHPRVEITKKAPNYSA